MATETVASLQALATESVLKATQVLHQQHQMRDFYGYDLSPTGNGCYLAVFTLMLLFFLVMACRSNYQWFNICFVCGFGVEVLSYLGRTLAINNHSSIGYFVMQNMRLGLAPAFIYGGICFLFAQNVVVYGSTYTVMKPMWYPYFFVGVNEFTLVLQAIGGGLAPQLGAEGKAGKFLMIFGVIAETVSVGVFLLFCALIPYRIYFHDRDLVKSDSMYTKRSVFSFIKMFLNVPSAQKYKQKHLDHFYNPRYQGIRLRPLANYYPLVIFVSMCLYLVRCILMVVTVKQGWNGTFATNEVYLFTLDSLPIALIGVLFMAFHPVFVFGRDNVLRVTDLNYYHEPRDKEAPNFSKRPRDNELDLISLENYQPRRSQKCNETLYM